MSIHIAIVDQYQCLMVIILDWLFDDYDGNSR